MNRKKHKIFYDGGLRWIKIKKTLFLLSIILIGITAVEVYAFMYSPFEETQDNLLYEKIEDINNTQRPSINKGTFVDVKNVYGKDYVWRYGEDKKIAILTFDDGPHPVYTPQILDILDKENIKATFFVTGNQIYKHPEIGRKIISQGSDMGVHTFSHFDNPDDEALDRSVFIKELDFTQKIFAYEYGYKTNLFRVPFFSVDEKISYDTLQYIREAKKRGLIISAPTVDSIDWQIKQEKSIIKRSTTTDVQTAVILLHDAGGERESTVEALPEVIKFYKDRGYEFTTISALATQYNLPLTQPITLEDRIFVPVAYHTYNFLRQSPQYLQSGFMIALGIVILHVGLFVLLAIVQVVKEKFKKRSHVYIRHRSSLKESSSNTLVSVIIPVYNEEESIKSTIRSVLKSTYKKIEIIVVDDGSSDKSYFKALEIKDPRVRVYTKNNGGKFSALNYGFKFANGSITVCLDADTRLAASAIREILQSFTSQKIVAVAGNVRVGNNENFLTKLQSLEYIIGQSIEKRSFDVFGAVMVVPGAFGAWRTKSVRSIGGFSSSTLAEDFDLTVSLIKKKHKVVYADKALAFTEAPLKLSQLFTQRYRWTFGNLQVYFKHRDMLFKRKYGAFGLFFLPRAFFIQIPSIFIMPLIDLFVVYNLLFGQRSLTILFILIYLIIHILVGVIAFILIKQRPKDLLYVSFLRFPYAQFLYLVFFVVLLRILKGQVMSWSKLQHNGRVSISRT